MEIVRNLDNYARRSEYNENGFIIEKQFFDKNEISLLLEQIKTVFGFQMERKGLASGPVDFQHSLYQFFKQDFLIFKNCGKQVQHLVDLWRLSLSEEVITYLIDVCGITFPSVATRPVVMFNSKNLATNETYHTVQAHQDAASMQGSDNAVVTWIPLIDIELELGPLKVVPKSHKGGVWAKEIDEFGFGCVPEGTFKEEDFISLSNLEAGDIVFFNSKLVHKSGNLSCNDIRWTAQFRYNDLLESNFIERGYPHPYVYKPVALDY